MYKTLLCFSTPKNMIVKWGFHVANEKQTINV